MEGYTLVFDMTGATKWINKYECLVLNDKPVEKKSADNMGSTICTYVSRRDGTQTSERLIVTPGGKYVLESKTSESINVEQISQQDAAMWLVLNDYTELVEQDQNLKDALEKSKLA